ncbi:hypothetical protein DKX38_011788 [Salix brachista]|uniref:Uncharacterized protein n=1 Tax=Salix brachista TaxID=2182728 RepID=A0A5N5M047_9ROSI|nr:hypothetical protein DKX38_011788 [Salix brachista]
MFSYLRRSMIGMSTYSIAVSLHLLAHRLIGDEEGIWIREKLEQVMRSGEDDGGFWRWGIVLEPVTLKMF